jgi:7-carboxy-7-deazaguanine synthase
MHVAEIFRSRQGEGLLTGTESAFVRVGGCNLRCWYCDTPYASWRPSGRPRSVAEIVDEVRRLDVRHAVLTGGEPMLYAEMPALTAALRRLGMHVTIETAGTRWMDVACDLMSISPKLSNATPPEDAPGGWRARHEKARRTPEIVRRLVAAYPYQLKFVVGTLEDCQEVENYLEAFPEVDRTRTLLMPLGTRREALKEIGRWLAPYCAVHRFGFCPRRQIEWYGANPAT